MIEMTVREFLAGRMAVPVTLEKRPGPPESYLLIEKTGSREENGLKRATLAVQSIAPSLYGAAALNEQVKAEMKALTELTNIFRCHCDNDYNFTNTETKERRYQAVFQIFYKE